MSERVFCECGHSDRVHEEEAEGACSSRIERGWRRGR